MPSASIQEPKPSIDFKSYIEDEDFLVEGNAEPSSRSQVLIFRLENLSWWVKVTLRGEVLRITDEQTGKRKTSKRQRRKEYQDFIRLIDFGSLPLFDDTVSEVILEESNDRSDPIVKIHGTAEFAISPFVNVSRKLKYTVREDPSRVIYPLCDEFPSLRKFKITELFKKTEITDGVFHVIDSNDETPYILKAVNRPLYQPHDTEVIRTELKNLEYFRGEPNIVQPAGVAVITNPYATSNATEQPLVIFGILLVFYPGGSLQNLFNENRVREHPWGRWTTQIATAINCLHEAGKTHMDIKPSNVVIDGNGNAVLIDISGVGGITHEWRAPEIRDDISPGSLSFEVRQLNDTWAYGKLLSEIISHGGASPFSETLDRVVACLTREDTLARMTLPEAISRLKASGIERTCSVYSKYIYNYGNGGT
ncbi:hypothetical protein Aspvir_005757 [Aspergillus viridinutans]|uniref:Protein kinase domain-containing protein n=1 Tax=Aspergillus viridinutans TaxID=75553 RepID=A0A9P3C0B1_ASPVI|nr:uncharacterized protein Aspvir_005757 [Aspergillus viridinutans]GIK01719.1 hypothetical protein Aspvir_005757 [Aspergillus viridinutans]